MILIDLKRIKNLRFCGTYLLSKSSDGGDLPDDIDLLGKTVHMYTDFELAPTTHFIINDNCKMYMKHSSVSFAYTDWEEFKEKK